MALAPWMRARSVTCAFVSFAVVSLASPARAVDPFEIQVYDGTANARHAFGLELHTNAVVRGLTATEPSNPEFPQNHQTHFTLEPSFGLTDFWELGAYLQGALRADGTFDYAGVKLRSKFVTPPKWHPHVRLGVNLEVSLLPEHYDRDEWGAELRPILAWENDDWLFSLNPIVDASLAGPGSKDGPSLQPAAMALYQWKDKASLGFEYYANLGAFAAGFSPIDKEEHYVYEVVNVLSIRHVELNIGFGQGLTDASNRFVAKLILGYSFDKDEPPARKAEGMLRGLPRRAR